MPRLESAIFTVDPPAADSALAPPGVSLVTAGALESDLESLPHAAATITSAANSAIRGSRRILGPPRVVGTALTGPIDNNLRVGAVGRIFEIRSGGAAVRSSVVTISPRADRQVSADPAGQPDAALLARIALGDERACRSFVDRHAAAMLGLAIGLCRDRGLAEDVTQRAFERVWRHAGSFDADRASARTWVLMITRRLAIDELRRRRPQPLAPEDLAQVLAPAPSDTEQAALRDAERDVVARALALLPEEQRRAVVLATLGGRSAAEVAVIDGIPLGTAKTRIRLGLRRLRTSLDGEVDRG